MGHLLKYSENLSASRVAEVTITFKSGLRFRVFFNKPKRTSVAIVRYVRCQSLCLFLSLEQEDKLTS